MSGRQLDFYAGLGIGFWLRTCLILQVNSICSRLDKETLVVVEVRSTASDRSNALEQTAASVDLRKQRKITGATLRFLAARNCSARYPFGSMCWC